MRRIKEEPSRGSRKRRSREEGRGERKLEVREGEKKNGRDKRANWSRNEPYSEEEKWKTIEEENGKGNEVRRG